jgi:hypothetical protein
MYPSHELDLYKWDHPYADPYKGVPPGEIEPRDADEPTPVEVDTAFFEDDSVSVEDDTGSVEDDTATDEDGTATVEDNSGSLDDGSGSSSSDSGSFEDDSSYQDDSDSGSYEDDSGSYEDDSVSSESEPEPEPEPIENWRDDVPPYKDYNRWWHYPEDRWNGQYKGDPKGELGPDDAPEPPSIGEDDSVSGESEPAPDPVEYWRDDVPPYKDYNRWWHYPEDRWNGQYTGDPKGELGPDDAIEPYSKEDTVSVLEEEDAIAAEEAGTGELEALDVLEVEVLEEGSSVLEFLGPVGLGLGATALFVFGPLCELHVLPWCKKRVCRDPNGHWHSHQKHCMGGCFDANHYWHRHEKHCTNKKCQDENGYWHVCGPSVPFCFAVIGGADIFDLRYTRSTAEDTLASISTASGIVN